jgi:hypothetical protein
LKEPEAVGVPLIVKVLPNQDAVTPAGRPVAAPIPVAPVVVKVMEGESAVLIQSVGLLEAAETVFKGFTVIVPVALSAEHPPVIGIV